MSDSNSIQRLADASVGWIGAADNKAAALLGVSNILLGAVFLADLDATTGWLLVVRVLFVVLVLAQHVVVAAFVLWPRTNRVEILKKAGFPKPLPHSPSFFSDMAKLKHDDFQNLMQDASAQNGDKLEQAYVLAIIANRKMVAYQWSIGLFVAGLVAFCTLAAVELLPGATESDVKAVVTEPAKPVAAAVGEQVKPDENQTDGVKADDVGATKAGTTSPGGQ